MENGGEKAGGAVGEVQARVSAATRQLDERFEDVRGWAGDAGESLREFVRERPGVAIGLAAGLGFVLGRIFSRT